MTDWHETEVRVRYSETDAMGLLHHSNYVSYFEIARTELFRSQGGDYRGMEARGFYLVVVEVNCRYKRPASFDDVLTVRARLAKWSAAKLVHEYEVRRSEEVIALGRTVLACVDRDGKPQRMSQEILFPNADT